MTSGMHRRPFEGRHLVNAIFRSVILKCHQSWKGRLVARFMSNFHAVLQSHASDTCFLVHFSNVIVFSVAFLCISATNSLYLLCFVTLRGCSGYCGFFFLIRGIRLLLLKPFRRKEMHGPLAPHVFLSQCHGLAKIGIYLDTLPAYIELRIAGLHFYPKSLML